MTSKRVASLGHCSSALAPTECQPGPSASLTATSRSSAVAVPRDGAYATGGRRGRGRRHGMSHEQDALHARAQGKRAQWCKMRIQLYVAGGRSRRQLGVHATPSFHTGHCIIHTARHTQHSVPLHCILHCPLTLRCIAWPWARGNGKAVNPLELEYGTSSSKAVSLELCAWLLRLFMYFSVVCCT